MKHFRVSTDFSESSPLLDNFIYRCLLVFLLWCVEDLLLSWPTFFADHVDCIVVTSWFKGNGGKLSVTVFWIFARFVLFSGIGFAAKSVNLNAWLIGIDINLPPSSVVNESASRNQLFFFKLSWFVNHKLIIYAVPI